MYSKVSLCQSCTLNIKYIFIIIIIIIKLPQNTGRVTCQLEGTTDPLKGTTFRIGHLPQLHFGGKTLESKGHYYGTTPASLNEIRATTRK